MRKRNVTMAHLQRNRVLIHILLVLILFEQVWCHRHCGKGVSHLSLVGYVYGGIDSEEGDWPWMVAIVKKNETGDDIFLCTGFLIDRKHFVSAAHCFETLETSLYSARIGHVNLTLGDLYNISRIALHDEYIKGHFYDDIALITLSEDVDVPNFNPVCLPPRGTFANMTGRGTTVVGWGATSSDNSMSVTLKQLSEMPVVSNEFCESVYGERFNRLLPQGITSGLMCAGFQNEPGKDSCGGDSGGPLMIQEQNRWYAVGVVSFGIFCGSRKYPGVYSRLSTYLTWINQNRRDNLSCPDPGIPREGYRMDLHGQQSSLNHSFRKGKSIVFSCRGEETAMFGTPLITCTEDGTWSAPLPRCVPSHGMDPISCSHPGVDKNGEVDDNLPNRNGQTVRKQSRFLPGSQLKYSCRDGFALQGSDTIYCLRSGRWSGETPTCELVSKNAVINCGYLDPISYGRVVVYRTVDSNERPGTVKKDSADVRYPVGTWMEYSCAVGYSLKGTETLVCEPLGFWSAEPPVCVEDCGVSLVKPTPKITNVNRTVAAEWPWMVELYVNGNKTLSCGGTLLDRRTIVTTAHCVSDKSGFFLVFGKVFSKDEDRKDCVEIRRKFEIILHPEYNQMTFQNNIALIRLESNLRYSERILPICLPTPQTTAFNLIPGNKGIVTGWGVTEKHLSSDELMKAEIPVKDNSVCETIIKPFGVPVKIRSKMLCGGYTGDTSVCRGDGGSPFVFYNSTTERYTLEGLVSFSLRRGCGFSADSIFTKISNFLPWIEKTKQE